MHNKLIGVDGYTIDSTTDKDYNPEQVNDEDSEAKDTVDSNNNNDDKDDAPEIKILDDGANVNKETKDDKENQGVYDKTTGVEESEEIPGVDGAKKNQGMDDETPENETESDMVEVKDKRTERTSGGMNLRRQPQRNTTTRTTMTLSSTS